MGSERVRPWYELVDELRAASGTSQDDLAYEARKHGASPVLTGTNISQVKNGKRPLHTDFLEGLAGALGIEPTEFAEYRLAIVRQALDEKVVGLDQAAANLEAISPSETPAEVVERVGAALEQRLGRELRQSRPSRGRSAASKRASGSQ